MASRPSDFAATVRANWRRTVGFIHATAPATVALRDRTLATIDRRLVALGTGELPAGRMPTSWMLAVLLAPGEVSTEVGAWVARRRAEDQARVRFYLTRGARAKDALAGWYAQDLDDPRTADIDDWSNFHKQFGADLNGQIYRDARR